MYFLFDTLILPIFATTAFSSLGQASQVAEKCLQGCLSKALLSPQNIECSVDKISPCFCAWAPLRDINFCCLVNNCLLSPEDAIYQWTVDCAKIGVPVPAFSIDILCSENGGQSSPMVYAIPSRTIDYYKVDSTIGGVYKGTITISHIIELRSSILDSASRESSSTTINSKPNINISAPFSPSPTTALPATALGQPSSSPSSPKTQNTNTAGDSPANKDEKKKLGLILGLSIPAAILALAAIIFFFWIRRLKSKKSKRMAEAEVGDEQKSLGLSKERLSDIPEEEGGGKEKASRLSELHSDPIPPYSTELPGTPAPQLIELPG